LQCVTAHDIESGKLKTLRRIRHVRSHNLSQHVWLATAGCARTGTAKKLQIKIRFDAVIPNNREFIADLLNVRWLQTHDVENIWAPPPIIRASGDSARQKLRCQLGQASPLPRRQRENHSSSPWKGAGVSSEIQFQAGRATSEGRQNIYATFPPAPPVAGLSLSLRSTNAAARGALPYLDAIYQAEIRTCSPRLPHLPRARRADAFRPPPRFDSYLW